MFLRESAARGDDPRRSSTGRERLAVITSRTEARKDLAASPPLSRVRRAVPRVVVVSYFVVSRAAPRATSDWGSAVRGGRRCVARGAASVEYVALPTSCELAGRAVQRRAGPVRAGGPGAGRARARGAKSRGIHRLDLENSPGVSPTKRGRNFGKRIHVGVRCNEF